MPGIMVENYSSDIVSIKPRHAVCMQHEQVTVRDTSYISISRINADTKV